MRDFSHSVMSVVAVRLMLLGEKPLTMLGNISLSLAGDSGVSRSGLDDSSSVSGIEGVSSVALVLTVDPLHRDDLVDAGDSQFDQSVSSSESKPKGVHEKRLFLIGLTFSLPTSLVLAGGVGVAAREPAKSKVVMMLGRAGWDGLIVSLSFGVFSVDPAAD